MGGAPFKRGGGGARRLPSGGSRRAALRRQHGPGERARPREHSAVSTAPRASTAPSRPAPSRPAAARVAPAVREARAGLLRPRRRLSRLPFQPSLAGEATVPAGLALCRRVGSRGRAGSARQAAAVRAGPAATASSERGERWPRAPRPSRAARPRPRSCPTNGGAALRTDKCNPGPAAPPLWAFHPSNVL